MDVRTDYPPPPWHTRGFGVFVPCPVRTDRIALPAGFEPIDAVGRSLGVLCWVRYEAGSPLEYEELIWMPCPVRCTEPRVATFSAAPDYWVARMYVDHEGALEAGRREWALPKTLATFTRTERGVRMNAEDGTQLELTYRAAGPRLPVAHEMATLQRDDHRVVRFAARFRGRMKACTASVTHFVSGHDDWAGFTPPRARPAAVLAPFTSEMRVPIVLHREPRSRDATDSPPASA